ncbi:zinc-binding alcohol dehydrogenase family protein [Schleiferilactobacillus shenzhenensis]|uniref:Zinc-type alcohol dehydrogenase-like protein n=1 Tax=Schleiferilactobacillus shenzhenensis LY-73 TaxID=1231336 RepID=U4TVW2_9LACO|nr:zinc-binding alcohol dehydrogenase family protein [Schleiferilactobacillus shenzhenensis]ERL65983.1 Zinc-type alcohol dehydrogenase-like protein [Schleiferilactobacillus shenzhenensis LY-73]
MKAIGYTQHLPISDPRSLVDITLAKPTPTGHDLLVNVKAVSVNPVDTGTRRAGHGTLAQPKVIGWDAVGTVTQVGSAVTRFHVGDRVYYAGNYKRPGSDAEYQLVDERIVGHAPKQLTDAEAAAMPLTSLTAWEALFEKLHIATDQPDQNANHSILIINGSGGVGSVATQLAHWAGLQVLATASRPESQQWVRAHGADHVLNHRQPLPAQLHQAGYRYVDYILNLSHLDEHWPEIAEMIRPDGWIAAITENRRGIDLQKLTKKRATFAWEWMYSKSWYGYDLDSQGAILDRMAALLAAGTIQCTLTKTITPLNAASLRQAHALVESGHMIGKVVVSGPWA